MRWTGAHIEKGQVLQSLYCSAREGNVITDLLSILFLIAMIGAIAVGLYTVYRRSFDAGEIPGEEAGIKLSREDLETIYWLATNGFRRLLLLRERGSGFQSEEQAEQAHQVLDCLEHYLRREQDKDASFNRIADIRRYWPKAPLSAPQKLLKQLQLDEEP